MTKFEKRNLDIVDVLNSSAVVGMYRGKEAWTAIEELMNEVSDGTLVLIDIRRANPLQYVFCQHAFGPLFQALKDRRWLWKYVIFQMYDFHKPGFFRGVLKYLGSELPRKESEAGFISAGMYTKLIVGDEDSIGFIGNLNTYEQTILKVVDNLREATAKQVVEKSDLSEEIVVYTLQSLGEKYFIVGPINKSRVPHYYSFYNYLRKE